MVACDPRRPLVFYSFFFLFHLLQTRPPVSHDTAVVVVAVTVADQLAISSCLTPIRSDY